MEVVRTFQATFQTAKQTPKLQKLKPLLLTQLIFKRLRLLRLFLTRMKEAMIIYLNLEKILMKIATHTL